MSSLTFPFTMEIVRHNVDEITVSTVVIKKIMFSSIVNSNKGNRKYISIKCLKLAFYFSCFINTLMMVHNHNYTGKKKVCLRQFYSCSCPKFGQHRVEIVIFD